MKTAETKCVLKEYNVTKNNYITLYGDLNAMI